MSEILKENPKYITIEEFDKFPEDNTHTYELIDGVVCMSPRPNYDHQSIMFSLSLAIGSFFKGKPCKAFTEVELEINKDIIIPDISIFCNVDTKGIQRTIEPPILVIEILSPSNTAIEMEDKRQKFKSHCIKEYWLVNPKHRTITLFDLSHDTNITYTYPNSFTSLSFPDLNIKLNEAFDL